MNTLTRDINKSEMRDNYIIKQLKLCIMPTSLCFSKYTTGCYKLIARFKNS